MQKTRSRRVSHHRPARRPIVALGTSAGFLMAAASAAPALTLYAGNYDDTRLAISLNTTVEYSSFYRVDHPSLILAGPTDANGNEGDADFRHGIVDNTFEALPVFDVKYGDYGLHVSGQLYLDTPYLQKNQNNQPGTFNPLSPSSNRDFTSATRNINGENAELLDAFVYGSRYFGADDNQEITLKVGRQTLLWGQSLFFSNNGIAAGQAPIDIRTAESLPNAQTQQVVRPVGQVVVTYHPNTTLTLQGYYQFEWAHDMFQGVGAYFSSADLLDKGGQRIIVGPDLYLYRAKDVSPPIQNGQFGASLQGTYGNYDVGIFGLRYDSKTPEIYSGRPFAGQGPGNVGSYYLVYPRDIQIYGAALSTTVGSVNIGGEVSGRRNMPLISTVQPAATYPASANAGALYATGSTFAAQLSEIYISPGIMFDPGGVSLLGEFAMNHVLSVDRNKAALTPGHDNTAGAFQIVATPTYYEVLPSLELQFPIGLQYNLFGRSEIDPGMYHGTGTINFGITATYKITWTAGLTYQDYLGRPDPSLNPLADRGYLSFNVEHTF